METRRVCMRCGSAFASEAEFCPHDGSRLVVEHDVPDPLLGTTLLGEFEIRAVIGSGGMGTVYRAHQATTDRDVAIKVLRPELARDDEAVVRFQREARVATRLDHPNLVNVFLSGTLPDGRLYLVMEFLKGRSLDQLLDETPLLELERALKILLKLSAGVGAMHAQGVIHRDIKPDNVFLVDKGADPEFAKLVDFGIARHLESNFSNTRSGRVFGTANYISPEAAAGEDVDQRSDIYSLGVLAYQLFCGELPFEAETAGAVLLKHVNDPAPHIHTRVHGERVPSALADVVMSALSKHPDSRPQSAGQFIEELAAAATQEQLLADVQSLLLGTMWHDEMTEAGSLAQILGAAPDSEPRRNSASNASDWLDPDLLDQDDDFVPAAMAEPMSHEDEELLSSAPAPFGTASMEMTLPRHRARARMLWTVLGGVALLAVGFVAMSWWTTRASTATAEPERVAAVPESTTQGATDGRDTSGHDVAVGTSPTGDTIAQHGRTADDNSQVSPGSPDNQADTQDPSGVKPDQEASGDSKDTAAGASTDASTAAANRDGASTRKTTRRRRRPRTTTKPVQIPVAPSATPTPSEAPSVPAARPTEPVNEEGIDWTLPSVNTQGEERAPGRSAPPAEGTTPSEPTPPSGGNTPSETAPPSGGQGEKGAPPANGSAEPTPEPAKKPSDDAPKDDAPSDASPAPRADAPKDDTSSGAPSAPKAPASDQAEEKPAPKEPVIIEDPPFVLPPE